MPESYRVWHLGICKKPGKGAVRRTRPRRTPMRGEVFWSMTRLIEPANIIMHSIESKTSKAQIWRGRNLQCGMWRRKRRACACSLSTFQPPTTNHQPANHQTQSTEHKPHLSHTDTATRHPTNQIIYTSPSRHLSPHGELAVLDTLLFASNSIALSVFHAGSDHGCCNA